MCETKNELISSIQACINEMILEQKSLNDYDNESKRILSKYFEPITRDIKHIGEDPKKSFDFAKNLKKDDWYNELATLLLNCKIKNVITAELKLGLKQWIKDWPVLVDKTGDDNLKFKTDMKKLLLVNNTDDFIEQFLFFIKTHCIEIDNENDYFVAFKSDALYMVYRILNFYKIHLNDLTEEAKTLNDLLLIFAFEVGLENKISTKDINVIKSMTYYGENNCKPVVLEMLDMIEKYNATLTEKQNKKKMEETKIENVCSTNVDIEGSYQDEEECFSKEEKLILNNYLNENVFDKFGSINNAYNPKVSIDAEELYKNMPCGNKKEGLDLMLKKLKSNNVNHEINSLIIRLNLLQKDCCKIKK